MMEEKIKEGIKTKKCIRNDGKEAGKKETWKYIRNDGREDKRRNKNKEIE